MVASETTTTQAISANVPTFSCFAWWKQLLLLVVEVDSVSAARRRRERRHRQFFRHERLSVAMALSEKKHHTSRGQRKDIAGRWVRDVLHGQVLGAPTPQPELFQLYEEEPGGSGPPCLGEPRGPQEEVQQRTVEQLADVVPMVQILDIPGPQEGDQVVVVLRKLDVPAVEQVIAVPLISLDRVPHRSVLRCPQKAEKLVEVPTEPGYSLAVIAVQAMGWRAAAAMAEHIVDNPVPQVRRGGGGGLPGLRSGQGSTAADVKQIVVIPVLQGRRGNGGGSQGSLPEQNSTAATVEQIVVFQLVEVFKVFAMARVLHQVDFFVTWMKELKGFFALFTGPKKVQRLPATRVPECPPVSAHPS